MRVKVLWEVVRDAGDAWLDDRGPRIGAAIAFFTALSLAPILVIALVIAGSVYGDEAARGEVADKLTGVVGGEAAKTIEGVLAASRAPRAGPVALVVSLITLFVGATGVFVELKEALNDVWKVRPKPGQGVRTFVRGRILSFGMVLAVGFLLLASVVLSAALEAADHRERVLQFEVVEHGAGGDDVFEQGAQVGDVPLAVAQFVDEPALGLTGRDVERLVEGAVGRADAQGGVEDEERLADRVHDVLCVVLEVVGQRSAVHHAHRSAS